MWLLLQVQVWVLSDFSSWAWPELDVNSVLTIISCRFDMVKKISVLGPKRTLLVDDRHQLRAKKKLL